MDFSPNDGQKPRFPAEYLNALPDAGLAREQTDNRVYDRLCHELEQNRRAIKLLLELTHTISQRISLLEILSDNRHFNCDQPETNAYVHHQSEKRLGLVRKELTRLIVQKTQLENELREKPATDELDALLKERMELEARITEIKTLFPEISD